MKGRRPRAGNAQHSQATCEHGTPREVVELVRYALGRIDRDVCSSAYWNTHSVRASDFYDRDRNGLDPRNPWDGTVICNPPGADDEAGTPNLVRPFYDRLIAEWRAGKVEGAAFIGYSLEQLVALQESTWSPLLSLTLVPSARLEFLIERPGRIPARGTSPTHGNFVTLLHSTRFGSIAAGQIARFVERGRRIGSIVRPA